MSMILKGGESSAPRFTLEEGIVVGTLVQVVDLGIQKLLPYKGEPKPDTPQIKLVFEVADSFIDAERTKPAFISKTVKKSAHPKSTLFKVATALLGGGKDVIKALEVELDLPSLLGRGAQINVAHFENESGDTLAYIESVLPLPKGQKAYGPITEKLLYDTSRHDQTVFDKLPEFTRKKIESRVLTGAKKAATVMSLDDEDRF